MEDETRKEMRNRRILAIIAVLVLAFAYVVSGQTVSFRKLTDSTMSIKTKSLGLKEIHRVEVGSLDNEANFISWPLPVIKTCKDSVIVSMRFFQNIKADNTPNIMAFKHGYYEEDYFTINGKKLVDIFDKK